MAIDFPDSPTNGDTYTAGGRTWTYGDGKWVLASGPIGPTGPTGPTPNLIEVQVFI